MADSKFGLFDARRWTGDDDVPLGGVNVSTPVPPAAPTQIAVMERPRVVAKVPKSAPVPEAKIDAMTETALAEYAELAEYVGIMPPDLGIETFKAFLRASGWTVFQLADVVAYMDDKARKESKEQAGWEWRPLREKDHRRGLSFGTCATRKTDQYGRASGDVVAGSDFYAGPHTVEGWSQNGMNSSGVSQQYRYEQPASSHPYDRTIPIHAVRKIAAIEKNFKGDVAFFVCDYALAPAIQYPDPFLMAVVPNPKANIGVGRFIIDFWDEPGFGIEHMVKTDL